MFAVLLEDHAGQGQEVDVAPGSCGVRREPSTPQEALSATVSWILIFRPGCAIDDLEARHHAVGGARTSAAVTPRAYQVGLEDEATSASARRAIILPVSMASPSLKTMPGEHAEVGLVDEHVHHDLAGHADLLADDGLAGGFGRRAIMRCWIW